MSSITPAMVRAWLAHPPRETQCTCTPPHLCDACRDVEVATTQLLSNARGIARAYLDLVAAVDARDGEPVTPPTPEEMEALRRFVRRHAEPCDTCAGAATVALTTVDVGYMACDAQECQSRYVCQRCGAAEYALPPGPPAYCSQCGSRDQGHVHAEVRDVRDAVAVRWAVRT